MLTTEGLPENDNQDDVIQDQRGLVKTSTC